MTLGLSRRCRAPFLGFVARFFDPWLFFSGSRGLFASSGPLFGVAGNRFWKVSGAWWQNGYLEKVYINIYKTNIFEGFTVHATELSANVGASIATVGC